MTSVATDGSPMVLRALPELPAEMTSCTPLAMIAVVELGAGVVAVVERGQAADASC